MGFKDIIKDDIQKVFFNADEFSETHTIDGREMRAIIDSMELLEREKSKSSQYTDGLYLDQNLIYIPVEDYGPRPRIGKSLLLDGKKQYIITDIQEENGVYSFTLERNVSR